MPSLKTYIKATVLVLLLGVVIVSAIVATLTMQWIYPWFIPGIAFLIILGSAIHVMAECLEGR